jgi:hypothetical protein
MIKGNLVPLGALEKYPIDTNKFEDVWFIHRNHSICAYGITDKYRKKKVKTIIWSGKFCMWDIDFILDY